MTVLAGDGRERSAQLVRDRSRVVGVGPVGVGAGPVVAVEAELPAVVEAVSVGVDAGGV